MSKAKHSLLLISLLLVCAEMWLNLRGRLLSANERNLLPTYRPHSATHRSNQSGPHNSTRASQMGLDPLALQYRVDAGVDNPSLPAEFQGGVPLLRLRTYPSRPRNETCRQCFRYVYGNVLRPRSCDAPGHVTVLVLVTTVPDARAARSALRRTWLSVTSGNTARVRHVFLLGAGWPPATQERMRAENELFGDILLDDFIDSYVNLSIKVMGGLRFALHDCRRAEYVMRTADDNYVNLPNVLRLIAQRPPQLMNGLVGACWELGAAAVRNKKNKWAVSWNEWPRRSYPPYCGGTTFFMARRTARQLFDGAQNVPFFVLEDVFFGEVSRLYHIPHRSLPHFGLPVPKIDQRGNMTVCSLHHDWRSLHPVKPLFMMPIWLHCQKVKTISCLHLLAV